jgi:hypothetical protein
MLAHNGYFSLKDNSPAARAKLLQACRQHLTGHPGTVFFACGTLEEGLRRPVNDLNFDVALHVIFTDRAAHDAYQAAARHQQFIAENRDNWKLVRVFDSTVE